MPVNVIIGAQWGDEGKGRYTDLLAEQAVGVARYSGGDNAGHTITIGSEIFKLHLLPSGVVQPGKLAVLGNGMVINPAHLLEEIDRLTARGVDLSPTRLKISHAAHLITPVHIALDRAYETARGEGKIGTTLRGIGPAYTDKIARRGLRVEYLLDTASLADRIKTHVDAGNELLTKLFSMEPLDAQRIANEYHEHAQRLHPHITDTSLLLTRHLRQGDLILAEGAQGTLLDIDFGTYPFVTSSAPTTGGVLTGLGISHQYLDRIIGVTKAFQTRVGAGPFPTEAEEAVAARLRGTGANPWDEYGTTTGRPRRCGWLDLVLLRYAVRINGLTELALTKLDVLAGIPELALCVAYAADGQTFDELPLGPANLEPFTAVYETVPGWDEDVTGVRRWQDLPENARRYVDRIGELTGVPVTLISVGPEREQVIRRYA